MLSIQFFLFLYNKYIKMKKDVTAFIRELLFGHDCVIVPGFGGFIGNYTPARIDKNSGTFSPPVKQISFNRNLNHNDGLLIGRISESAKINYGDSKTIVDEFVTDMRRRLSKGEKVVLDMIGCFYNNQEDNIQFEPDKESNYLLDSYGLTSFQCLPVEGYDVRNRIVKYREKGPMKQRVLRKTLWRAAVIIPLVAAITFASIKTDFFESWIQQTSMNPLATVEFENNTAAVEELPLQPATTEQPAIAAPTIITKSVIEEVVPVKEENTYLLVAGSFKSQENARSLMDRLTAKGYTPQLVEAPNGFYRVSAVSFNDLNQASAEKEVISKDFPGTWINKMK
jgi:nucleoid DNA-binding protein